MAKANRGSVKSKRPEVVHTTKDLPQKSEGAYIPEMAAGGQIINQPPSGITVDPMRRPITVESSPVAPVSDYSFTFEVRPGIGSRWNCVAIRDDGLEEAHACNSEIEANAKKEAFEKRIAEVAAARKEQEDIAASARAATPQPIVTPGGQVIELKPDHDVSNQPAVRPIVPEAVPGASLVDLNPKPKRPRFEGELVLPTMRKDLPDLHVIPELANLVLDFLEGLGAVITTNDSGQVIVSNEIVEAFSLNERGVTIVTHPRGQAATFYVVNGKSFMSR